MVKYDEKLKDCYLPDVETVNPYLKEEAAYALEVLQGLYGAYARGGTGISYGDRDSIITNRKYGKGDHDTEQVKGHLVGSKYPGGGMESMFSQSQSNSLNSLFTKAWDNVDWRPISPMPKIKAIVSKIADIDYDISCDAIDPLSKNKELDKKAYMMFFAREQEFIKRYSDNAGIPVDEPEYVPESDEELETFMAEDGFKAIEAMHQEILLQYSFEAGAYDEIKPEHVSDLVDNGIIALKITKDPNSGRFYPEYVDIANAFVQSSKHSDFRDSEYGGVFDTITISQMISFGASPEDVEGAMSYYSGWGGNATVDDDVTYTKRSARHNNMRVCVMKAAWIDNDIYRYKNYTNRYGRDRMKEQKGDEWGEIYDSPNRKTSEMRGRVVREGCWVVGTKFVYGYGKISNQPREDDRDVLLPYRFYKMKQKSMVSQCRPFLDGIQIGWSKLQNAFITAMNSGYALNVSMLQNLSYGQEKIDWLDAIKVMRGTGVMPYSLSLSGKYEGGGVTPLSPIEGGLGKMLEESASMMEMNMNNIHIYTGLNPLDLAEQADPNMPVRTAQMMASATNDVLKPFIRAGFAIKKDAGRVLNNMLVTCVQDKTYMQRAYGGILSEAAIDVLGMAKKHNAKYGLILRVRPTDEDKRAIIEMANAATELGHVTPDVNLYVKEKILEGANLKRIRKWLSYKIEKERQRKYFEQTQLAEKQSEGNILYEQEKQKTMQAEAQLDMQKQQSLEMIKLEAARVLEVERRLTEIMKGAMQSEELREQILNEAKEYKEDVDREEQDVRDADAPDEGSGEEGVQGASEFTEPGV